MEKILPTPVEIISALDRQVDGQEKAKRILARAVYNHYLSLALRQSGQHEVKFSSQHILLLGPTGSGKTHLIKALGEFLSVPLLFINAATLTAEGYVGESVYDALARLSKDTPEVEQRERAIVFLDEFDKLAPFGDKGLMPIRGPAVQQELLSVLDGNTLSRVKDSSQSPAFSIDTSKLLFIMTGAFSGLETIVKHRLGESQLGFTSIQSAPKQEVVTPEDLVTFGFSRELIGRIGHFATLTSLSEEALVRILSLYPSSPIRQQQMICKIHGIGLTYSDLALRQIARMAAEHNVGARGLAQIAHTCLQDVDYKLTELYQEGIRTISIQTVTDSGAELELSRQGSEHAPSATQLRARVFTKNGGMKGGASEGDAVQSNLIENADILSRLRSLILFDAAEWSAQKWWITFESDNKHRLPLLEKVADELVKRQRTLNDFFLAYVFSNTNNIQANLHFLDYRQLLRAPPPSRIKSKEAAQELRDQGELAYPHDLEALRIRLGYDTARPNAKLFWEVLSFHYFFERRSRIEVATEWANRGWNLDLLLREGARSQLVSFHPFDKWLLYRELSIKEISGQSTQKVQWEEVKPSDPKVRTKFERAEEIRQVDYLNYLLKCLPLYDKTDAEVTMASSRPEKLWAKEVNLTGEFETYKVIHENAQIIWTPTSFTSLMDYFSPWFQNLFIVDPPPEPSIFESIIRFTRYELSTAKLAEYFVRALTPPERMTAAQVNELVKFFQASGNDFKQAAALVWGPGPWDGQSTRA